MRLVHHEPENLMSKLQEDVNDLFRSWKLGSWMSPLSAETDSMMSSDWMPLVDINETEKKFFIKVDVPGVDIKDVDVTMSHGVLSIKGQRKSEKKEDNKDYHRIERFSGSFQRRFSLPDTADPENISAEMKDGVLSITIAKQKADSAKKITVQAK